MGALENMSKNNRKKVNKKKKEYDPNGAFGRFMLAMIILGIVILLFINVALPIVKEKFKKAAAEKTVDILSENIEKIAGDSPEAQKLTETLENMSEEDRETVTEIVAEHMDAETVSEVMEYVTDGDQQGLVEYATENLSPEEVMELMEIYGKYAD